MPDNNPAILWSDVKKWMLLKIAQNHTRLESTGDVATIAKLQGEITAYRSMLNLPEILMTLAEGEGKKG